MTDLEYIVKQAKKFYYIQWDEAELRKCVDMLPALEHDELVRLFNCKWTKKVLKEAIFNILYMDRIGEREERFKEMSTVELINDFEKRSKGNVSLIRQELRKRYKEVAPKMTRLGSLYKYVKSSMAQVKLYTRGMSYNHE